MILFYSQSRRLIGKLVTFMQEEGCSVKMVYVDGIGYTVQTV